MNNSFIEAIDQLEQQQMAIKRTLTHVQARLDTLSSNQDRLAKELTADTREIKDVLQQLHQRVSDCEASPRVDNRVPTAADFPIGTQVTSRVRRRAGTCLVIPRPASYTGSTTSQVSGEPYVFMLPVAPEKGSGYKLGQFIISNARFLSRVPA